MGGQRRGLHHLPGQRGLAHLARAREDLQETARLFHPPQQDVVKGLAYHNDLLRILSKLTQDFGQAENRRTHACRAQFASGGAGLTGAASTSTTSPGSGSPMIEAAVCRAAFCFSGSEPAAAI